jgi:signal transduction histidine kinase/HPt (histidine-containing phosphotransfer) domain-containing protein
LSAIPEQSAYHGLRALIVDDSESALDILQRMLQRHGIAVQTAHDGSTAIELVRKQPLAFDLILIDLVMEHVDGIETIKQLIPILEPRRVPLIPMSATLTPAIEESCRQVGAFPATLRKPFRANQVEHVLRDALAAQPEHQGSPANGQVRSEAHIDSTRLSVPGCDIAGALERCGGDPELLKKLLSDFRQTGAQGLEQASASLRTGDVQAADRSLHKLRGEFLNLGFIELAADLMSLQAEIAPSLVQVSSMRSALASGRNVFDPLIAKIALLRDRLLVTLEETQRLNALNDRTDAESFLSAADEVSADANERNFQRLIGLLESDNPAALSLASELGPTLLAQYDDATRARFHDHLEALEFPDALALLRPQDLSRAIAPSQEDSFRILIVDDAAVTVRLLSRLLDGMGSLRIALNGRHALKIAHEWHPDLIISDVDMGETSGIDLCRSVKSDPELMGSSVMLISASDDVAIEVEGLTAGAVDFLEKPLNPARVVGRVASQLSAIRRKAESASLVGELDLDSKTGFLTCDLSGQITDISPPLARWLEQPSRPQPGLLLHDLFEPAFFAIIDTAIRHHSRGGRIGPLETVMISVSGARLPVRLIGRDMPGPKTRVLWFGIEDISARVTQERDRSEAQVSRKIGVLASGIAHEFNNLLGVVIGRIDLALEITNDPKVTQHLNHASEAALRAANISRSLRDAADQADSKHSAPLTLADALEQCWPMLRNLVPPSVMLEREVQDATLAVRIDSKELRGLLMQLVENAADACVGGSTIRIRISRQKPQRSLESSDQACAVIEIIDTGSGMSADTLAHAFDAFFTTKGPQHTGLGLSQVQSTITNHGGQISLQSAMGIGTTVRIEFPVAQA